MSRANGGIVGVLNEPSSAMAATGGTVTTDGDYKVHVFTSNGNFQVTSTPSASGVFDLKSQYNLQKNNKWPSGAAVLDELLMVGGGGGGGVLAMDGLLVVAVHMLTKILTVQLTHKPTL